MPDAHEFQPDWTTAPAATLRAWMDEHGCTTHMLAVRCGRGETDIKASLIIHDVLDRRPLLPSHAETLERGTGIPAHMWLRLERDYRDGLAAGRKDTTDA
jgi:hypothetical protein